MINDLIVTLMGLLNVIFVLLFWKSGWGGYIIGYILTLALIVQGSGEDEDRDD